MVSRFTTTNFWKMDSETPLYADIWDGHCPWRRDLSGHLRPRCTAKSVNVYVYHMLRFAIIVEPGVTKTLKTGVNFSIFSHFRETATPPWPGKVYLESLSSDLAKNTRILGWELFPGLHKSFPEINSQKRDPFWQVFKFFRNGRGSKCILGKHENIEK